MGVIATGSIFKTLTFDGKSSAEFNVYITGEGVFNAPERAVEMISIPGRNGAFALDNGRFENIEVTYNCGIAGDDDTDFAEAVSAFRNWLCSRNGYVRLTDDYNANEYRMAVYKSGLEVAATQLIAGEFPIVFECKPQRFLTSGEEKISVGEWGETTTETGDIVEIENPDGILSVKSLTADINAEQDLNGYTSPWAGGAGVNKLPYPYSNVPVPADITVTDHGDGTLTVNGTTSGTKYYWFFGSNNTEVPSWVKPSTTYIAGLEQVQTGLSVQLILYGKNGESTIIIGSTAKTTPADFTNYRCGIVLQVLAGTYTDALVKPMIVEGSALTTWTPYSNICPITGHDTVNVVVSPTTEAGDGTTYSSALGSTVYGGTLDVVSGLLTVDKVAITYDGSGDENWLDNGSYGTAIPVNGYASVHSTNKYTALGNGPGSGLHNGQVRLNTAKTSLLVQDARAMRVVDFVPLLQIEPLQVVYELATPTTTTLTAQQVQLLLGANNIWADTGDVTVEFGQNPNILVNPTLFESRPMLEVTGSGAVNLNDDTIQINNDPIGDVVIFEQQTKNTASAWPVYIETQYANASDPIIVTECQYTVNWTLSHGTISDITYTTTGDGHAAVYDVGAGMKPVVWLEDVEFAFGTASTITTTATFTIVTTYYGTLTADITLSLAYDGANQLTLSHTETRPTQFSSANPRKTIGDVILQSSQIALGNPIYIDLNIGEAYKIENDVPVSVNNGVVIPAELPTLAPGANTITYDNTITQLDIVPRWWKI